MIVILYVQSSNLAECARWRAAAGGSGYSLTKFQPIRVFGCWQHYMCPVSTYAPIRTETLQAITARCQQRFCPVKAMARYAVQPASTSVYFTGN